ncbi:uncharacterized protein TNCV_3629281 [Trichonephila clavipes]|nr:uncharacterized protein TNCV_3629281 [Trichonephila clavipes]
MIERGTGAGAGVYRNHFVFYKAVGRDATNFDGEVDAIFNALNHFSAWKRRFAPYLSNEAKGKAWECLTSSMPVIPEFSRHVAVALFRLLTGHDCLNANIFKIRLKDTSASTVCNSGEPMD